MQIDEWYEVVKFSTLMACGIKLSSYLIELYDA